MNDRSRMLRVMLALLLGAAAFSCLFSLLLPASASLLAPTQTLTPTVTRTLTATPTPTPTLTPLPPTVVTPNMAETSHGEYFVREIWESAVGRPVVTEDFENEMAEPGELTLPYKTGNGFVLDGNGFAQILSAPELLSSGNLLHFRAGGQGLTFVFPENRTVPAFAFDYTTSENWRLTINDFDVYLPSGKNKFIGIILFQNVTLRFTLSNLDITQVGLSIDNISYVP
ncbi:MAG TPA: hypothetical protein VGK56_08505 [Anaerolineales bacterium]